MTDRTWHKGPPPHPGWWEASWAKNNGVWRWWDDSNWSVHASCWSSAERAAENARMPLVENEFIEWSDYYPKNARVPRIDPRKFQQSKE